MFFFLRLLAILINFWVMNLSKISLILIHWRDKPEKPSRSLILALLVQSKLVHQFLVQSLQLIQFNDCLVLWFSHLEVLVLLFVVAWYEKVSIVFSSTLCKIDEKTPWDSFLIYLEEYRILPAKWQALLDIFDHFLIFLLLNKKLLDKISSCGESFCFSTH